MITSYGAQFICDLCGAHGDTGARLPSPFRYDQAPMPEGWTNLEYILYVQFKDLFGSQLQHLCSVCSGLSIGGFVDRFRARLEHEKAAR